MAESTVAELTAQINAIDEQLRESQKALGAAERLLPKRVRLERERAYAVLGEQYPTLVTEVQQALNYLDCLLRDESDVRKKLGDRALAQFSAARYDLHTAIAAAACTHLSEPEPWPVNRVYMRTDRTMTSCMDRRTSRMGKVLFQKYGVQLYQETVSASNGSTDLAFYLYAAETQRSLGELAEIIGALTKELQQLQADSVRRDPPRFTYGQTVYIATDKPPCRLVFGLKLIVRDIIRAKDESTWLYICQRVDVDDDHRWYRVREEWLSAIDANRTLYPRGCQCYLCEDKRKGGDNP